MRLDEYQEQAHKTAVYPQEVSKEYLILGLCGEVGELANKYKKVLRGDANVEELEDGILHELGDILWYLSELANEFGVSLEVVAINNIQMLKDRKKAHKIHGSGDNR